MNKFRTAQGMNQWVQTKAVLSNFNCNGDYWYQLELGGTFLKFKLK